MRSRAFLLLGIFVAVLVLGAFALRPAAQAQVPALGTAQFDKSIQPFLAKHCVECHGPTKKKADLVLHVYKDVASLVKNRKVWNGVTQMVHAGEMPPQGRPRPDIKDTEAFLKAIAAIYEEHDRTAPPDPGRVTMRRLNKTEYNNTIRDLVGVDFDPSEDFPADDVGYGFDNIGDVLTLSPVLMERYLAAAEAITTRAVLVGDLPKPNTRTTAARFLEPAIKKIDEKMRSRGLFEKDKTISSAYVLTQDGEFKARVKGFAQQPTNEPVRFEILVNGKPVKEFTVKGTDGKSSQSHEVKIELKKGANRVAARLLNAKEPDTEAKDPKDAKDGKDVKEAPKRHGLMVENIQLEGPLDTRPLSHRRIMAHKEGATNREAAQEIIARFATKAYRRPVTNGEVERLMKVYDAAESRKERWDAGVQLMLQAVLVSPKFLFRIELDHRPDSKDAHPIDDYQLASRLSYFLWNTMPDDELFALAAKQQLHPNLEAQTRRMLKDSRAKSLVDNFATQWLQLRLLANHTPDKKLFPEFGEDLKRSMLKETQLFLGAILDEDRSILEIIDSKFTFLNERLAKHYGIADTNGNGFNQKPAAKPGQPIRGKEFVKVNFADSTRGGVLTQASILTITSNPTRTAPVKRGRWVLEQILGTPPPPPPPDVPELDGGKEQLKGTLRERMEQHRKNPSCAGCHARMDPIGFAFENFDAVGKYRSKDGDSPIDPTGELPGGQKFQGPQELKEILLGKKELFSRCLAEKMLTYATGRGMEYYDKRALDQIVAALPKNDFRLSALVVEITKSDPFRLRRGKESNP